LPIFIFDKNILDKLIDRDDKRVNFIHQTLTQLNQYLKGLGSGINVYYGNPIDIWKTLIKNFDVEKVFTNEDFEPYAIERDNQVEAILKTVNIQLQKFKDHVIFQPGEVLKDDGKPYTVYTPFSKKWLAKIEDPFYLKPYPSEKFISNFLKFTPIDIPSLESMNFTSTTFQFPDSATDLRIVEGYDQTRNYPGNERSTSKLGIHLRFGTISIRNLANTAYQSNLIYLKELAWREFFIQILNYFPHTVNKAFKPQYDAIPWRNAPEDFEKWCKGETGFPIVDAGMRELNETGYMHNRVRMVTASFLCKHLLLDWRLGEAYFAQKLLDFELASNVGNWQWAAGTGCDAAPYFRVFNPESQVEKFDTDHKYIRKWVPEYQSMKYTKPIVEHKFARLRAIDTYKKALGEAAIKSSQPSLFE
jgi:deoxyribodipyrimidine photo-lyase